MYQDFNIGPGYNPSLFLIVTDNGAGLPSTILGSVSYSGPVPPRALPASCKIACKPVPTAPGTNPTEYTTTITTTNSAGKPLTETGVVDILTDSNGSWFSSTTIFQLRRQVVAVAALFLQLLRHPQAPNLHPVANHLLLHHHLQVVKHHQLLQALVVNRLQLLQAQAVSLPQLYHQLAAVSHLQLSQVPVLNLLLLLHHL